MVTLFPHQKQTLAKKFNVCQATIYKIVKGLIYKEGDNYVEN